MSYVIGVDGGGTRKWTAAALEARARNRPALAREASFSPSSSYSFSEEGCVEDEGRARARGGRGKAQEAPAIRERICVDL